MAASGMAAISCTLLALCSAGEEVVASRTVFGGTYALLKNLLPRLGPRPPSATCRCWPPSPTTTGCPWSSTAR